jgi:hypothetical protein
MASCGLAPVLMLCAISLGECAAGNHPADPRTHPGVIPRTQGWRAVHRGRRRQIGESDPPVAGVNAVAGPW